MANIFTDIRDWLYSTQVPQQIQDVDVMGLLANGYFIVPFFLIVIYLLYRQSFSFLGILILFFGVWAVSGTEYMQNLTSDGELSLEKVLPVAAGAIVVLGILVYLLFGRSD